MLKTLQAPSQAKPLFPPHQKHRSMEYLPKANQVSQSAEVNLDFELCNIELGIGEGSPSSEEEEENTVIQTDPSHL